MHSALCDGEPPLGNYNPVDRDAIWLGAADVTLFVRNKKFTQGPPEPVELGSTRSNLYIYLVYVHKPKLIVSLKQWAEQLQKL